MDQLKGTYKQMLGRATFLLEILRFGEKNRTGWERRITENPGNKEFNFTSIQPEGKALIQRFASNKELGFENFF